jgi:subtilisin family serine protease
MASASQLQRLGIEPLWDKSRGAGVRVALLDGGVWTSNALPAERIETIHVNGGEQKPTSSPHGTWCASLIASSEEQCEGVVPEAHILSIQVIGDDGKVQPSAVVKGLTLALERGCDVISCSFVLPRLSSSKSLLLGLVRDAHLKGIPVFAAAGNQKGMPAEFPEMVQHAVVVSATTADDSAMDVNANQWTDIYAPGEGLEVVGDAAIPARWDGQTSGATALMSGVAALMLASIPAAARPTIGQAIEGLIKLTGVPLSGPAEGTARRVNPNGLYEAVQTNI